MTKLYDVIMNGTELIDAVDTVIGDLLDSLSGNPSDGVDPDSVLFAIKQLAKAAKNYQHKTIYAVGELKHQRDNETIARELIHPSGVPVDCLEHDKDAPWDIEPPTLSEIKHPNCTMTNKGVLWNPEK